MEKLNFENPNILKEEANEFQIKLDNLVSGSIKNGDRQQLRDLIVGGYINREYFNGLLQKYSDYNIEYKDVLRVDEMIDLLIPENEMIDKKNEFSNFTYIDKTILPTTKNETPSIKKGEGGFKKPIEIPRIRMFIDLLSDIGITPDKYDCIVGQNDQNMIRTLSYVMFVLKEIKKMIFVCNEEENATYVIYGQCDNAEKYYSLSKNEIQNLISSNFGKKIIWKNKENWKKEILEEIENISNNDVSKLSDEELKKIVSIEKIKNREKPYETIEEAKQAVKRLEITSQLEYKKRYKEDPRLPSHPDGYYIDNGWNDWLDLLGKENKEKSYKRIEEAKQAVKRLGIQSAEEYKKRYKEDPKLPSNPNVTYENLGWNDWTDYLEKKEKFYTYEEAKQAVKRLGITQLEYKKRYKEDLKLPSNPSSTYKNKGWNEWSDFLGKEKKEKPYKTIEEAKQAVKRLKIQFIEEYYKRYKEDPMLPASPRRKYKNSWNGWSDFLRDEKREEFYFLEEAKRAVKRLEIQSIEEYWQRYKEDPKLPSNPGGKKGYYKNKGWAGWPDFLGKTK